DPCGEFDRAGMGVAPVGVEAQLPRLCCGGLAQLRTPMADVHAVQGREPVEVALAVLVVDVAPLAPHDHRYLGGRIGPHPREVHPQMALRLLLKINGHRRHPTPVADWTLRTTLLLRSLLDQAIACSTCRTAIVRGVQRFPCGLGIVTLAPPPRQRVAFVTTRPPLTAATPREEPDGHRTHRRTPHPRRIGQAGELPG